MKINVSQIPRCLGIACSAFRSSWLHISAIFLVTNAPKKRKKKQINTKPPTYDFKGPTIIVGAGKLVRCLMFSKMLYYTPGK